MSNLHTGHQGFKAASSRRPPSLKPGETLRSRDTKFSATGEGLVYRSKLPAEIDPHRTINGEAYSVVTKADCRVPDRRGVRAEKMEHDATHRKNKEFIHASVFTTNFHDFKVECKHLATVPIEDYKQAFQGLAEGRGYVSYRRMKELLREVHGNDVPQWVIDKMTKYFDNNRDGHVTWIDMSAALDRFRLGLLCDVETTKVTRPEWVWGAAAKKATVQGGKPTMSTYTTDIGTYGTVPANRPIVFKCGMLSSSQDLMTGTSKDTYHIPGYCGFIPHSKTNARAVQHGDLVKGRQRHLNLLMNFHGGSLPYYTGHHPQGSCNFRGEKEVSPLTTSGAASLGMVL